MSDFKRNLLGININVNVTGKLTSEHAYSIIAFAVIVSAGELEFAFLKAQVPQPLIYQLFLLGFGLLLFYAEPRAKQVRRRRPRKSDTITWEILDQDQELGQRSLRLTNETLRRALSTEPDDEAQD